MSRLSHIPHTIRKVWRLGRSLHEGQARPDDLWAVSRLTPAEGRVFLQMDARDREHALRVAQALQAAQPEAGDELLAAALLHDCGKLVWPYRVWERVGAGLLPVRNSAALSWPPAQVRAHHPQWGAALIRRAGGRARVAALVAVHHAPASDPEAALLHQFDGTE